MKIKIRKLEDLPSFIPIIYIQDKGFKNSTPRMLGNNSHDVLVVSDNKRCLHYYNCQCGDGSECGDFNFARKEPICIDDEFYSRWCENVNLEKLIEEHDSEIRKQICDTIRNKFGYKHNKQLIVSSYNLCRFLDKIEKGE